MAELDSSPPPAPVVRFDDLVAGSAFGFDGWIGTLATSSISEVPAVLQAAAAAAAGGLWAAGFVSYEAAPAFDSALAAAEPSDDVPLAWFALFTDRTPFELVQPRRQRPAPYGVSAWSSSIGQERFEADVGRIRDLIAKGDTYQVNHTMRLGASFSGDAFEFYRDLALAQQGAYAAYLDVGRFQVASASPELFYARSGRSIITKPMKGTVRRGRWPEEDRRLHQWLDASEKDRAENLMIVDLLRNDLGRVAEFGSVSVDALFDIERYATVWQATSTISAELRADVSDADVFGALFPSGSVTGAPKPRTTEIIAELEGSPRGIYCGAIGFLAPPDSGGPDAEFSVAIRTVVVDATEGTASYGVGGGITWDSSPSGEYEEARDKARVLVERRPDFELLETLRWEPGSGFPLLDQHLDRMGDSASYFGFAFDRAACATALADAVSASLTTSRLRLVSDRNGSVKVEAEELVEVVQPVRLVVDDEPVSSRNVFLFHKTTNRREYAERAARHPDASDVLLVNERGEVTESTVANVLVKLDGHWYTPPLESGLLPGLGRQMTLGRGDVKERVILAAELPDAEEMALVNSVRGRMTALLVP